SLGQFLSPVFEQAALVRQAGHLSHSTEYALMAVSAVGAIAMAFFAYKLYVSRSIVPAKDQTRRGLLSRLSYRKFYIDEIYDACIVRPMNQLSSVLYRFVDSRWVDGIVRGLAGIVSESGKGIRLLQGGNVGFYLFL